MKKTILLFLAGMVLVLLACSPELPTAGSTPVDIRAPAEPASTSHPMGSPTVGSTPAPPPASGSTATFAVPTETPASNTLSPTPTAIILTSAATATPAESTVPTVATSPQADPVTTIVLALAVSETPVDLPVYSRDDWRHWIDEDGDCQDTRNEVLTAESLTDVTYRSDRRCRVDSGQWLAPYSGAIVAVPGDLDIDHMVPLANAPAAAPGNGRRNENGSMPTTSTTPTISSQ